MAISIDNLTGIIKRSPTFFGVVFLVLMSLYYVLAPGFLLTLPSTSSPNNTVYAVHGGVYALVVLLIALVTMMSKPGIFGPLA